MPRNEDVPVSSDIEQWTMGKEQFSNFLVSRPFVYVDDIYVILKMKSYKIFIKKINTSM